MLPGPGISEIYSKPRRGYNKTFSEHNHTYKMNDISIASRLTQLEFHIVKLYYKNGNLVNYFPNSSLVCKLINVLNIVILLL